VIFGLATLIRATTAASGGKLVRYGNLTRITHMLSGVEELSRQHKAPLYGVGSIFVVGQLKRARMDTRR
jgi:hypothetical protein